jgi:hypothetical protein
VEKLKRCAVAFVLLSSVVAAADQKDAQEHFKRGKELYDESNFAGALAEFNRAYESFPTYKLLYNIGTVHEAMSDAARAYSAFTRYLSEGGDEIAAKRRADVTAAVEKLKLRVATVKVETASGAEIAVDDESVGIAPLAQPLVVNVGRHRIAARLKSREPVVRVVEVVGQQQLNLPLEFESEKTPTAVVAKAPAVPVPEVQRVARVPGPPLWLYIGSGALLVAGVGTSIWAGASSAALVSARSRFGANADDLKSRALTVQRASLVADIVVGAAIAASATTLLWWIFDRPAPSSVAAVSIGVGPSAVFIQGQF